MKRNRMTAVCLAAASLFLVSACGGSGDGASSAQDQSSSSGKIAFLLPESKTAQYETQDRPWFFKNMEQL